MKCSLAALLSVRLVLSVVISLSLSAADLEQLTVSPLSGSFGSDLTLCGREAALAEAQLDWSPETALTVVLAARGYPGQYAKGSTIRGLDTVKGAKVRSARLTFAVMLAAQGCSEHAPSHMPTSSTRSGVCGVHWRLAT